MPPDYHTPRTTPVQPKISPADFLFVQAGDSKTFKIPEVNFEPGDRARQTELLMDQMPHVLTDRDSLL